MMPECQMVSIVFWMPILFKWDDPFAKFWVLGRSWVVKKTPDIHHGTAKHPAQPLGKNDFHDTARSPRSGPKKLLKNSGLLRPPLRTHWPGVEVINWRWPIWWHMWDCDWWWNPSFEDIWGMGWRNATKKGALNRSRMKNCSVLTRFQHNPRLSVARPAWLKALVDNEVHVEKFHARTVQKYSPGLLRW